MINKKRNIAADVIRCLAFFFVVSVHFFLNNGFYSEPVVGKKMFVMVAMRCTFITCVPLFLTLSGYLLRKKEVSVKYYTKIFKIILTYILASVACMVYAVVVLKYEMSYLGKLLDFSGAPYGWYIEMYLGLFLIIPFLNVLYNNLPSKGWKLCLVGTFVAITALPSVVNVYNFASASWWALPSSDPNVIKIIPSWWTGIYPVTYYFMGCYLGEYGFKLKKRINIVLILACILIFALYSYWRSYPGVFIWGMWTEYNSLFTTILTLLIFGFLLKINYDRVPRVVSVFAQKLSGLCLGAYLVSWIFDTIVYPQLLIHVPVMADRLIYYFVVVPVIYVLSLAFSFVIDVLQKLLEKVFVRIIHAVHSKKDNA